MQPTAQTSSLAGRTIALVRYEGRPLDPPVKGIVKEDTKHTLVVDTPSGPKAYRKAALACTIAGFPGQDPIDGKTLVGKLHERIKNQKHR